MSVKERCQSAWKALACEGNNYNNDHTNNSKRAAAVKKFLKNHPECGSTGDHTAYVSEHSKCSRMSGGARGKTRKARKSTRKTRSRRH